MSRVDASRAQIREPFIGTSEKEKSAEHPGTRRGPRGGWIAGEGVEQPEARRAVMMAQSSQQGRVDKRAPNSQKCSCCLPPMRAPSGRDGTDGQEDTEC